MRVRTENEQDKDAVYSVNAAAFEGPSEARLVDLLRERAHPLISLVADLDDHIIGHIMFSPVTISSQAGPRIMGLAPMSVMPKYQRQGIGAKLVQEGLRRCRQAGVDAVVVLGHPHYYPRFGFFPAVNFGLRSEYEVPEDVFMAIELRTSALEGTTGLVRYHEAFNEV